MKRASAATRLGCDLMKRGAAHGMSHERMTMRFNPSPRVAHSPRTDGRSGDSSGSGGDGFTGGCISLIVLLIEVPVTLLLGLILSLRGGWSNAHTSTAPPTMDWLPTLWLGGVTLAVLVVAIIFLRSGHPYAGTVQLLIAAMALVFALSAWHDAYDRAHPAPLPTCPTRAGTPCAATDR
ncbi:DUF6234 family protein [Streptomyces sp. NPDC016845]|uniref:DUF6234 family protein n=1 Tax=Streptomyces sp. NPDC016845 TaxID=3364972 RepID=UPI003796E4FA